MLGMPGVGAVRQEKRMAKKCVYNCSERGHAGDGCDRGRCRREGEM